MCSHFYGELRRMIVLPTRNDMHFYQYACAKFPLLDKASPGTPEWQLQPSYSLFKLFDYLAKEWLKSKKEQPKLPKPTLAVGKAGSLKTTSED